jgi:hypothetical protein
MDQLSYRRHRFPPPIIQHTIWLYLRFTLEIKCAAPCRCRDFTFANVVWLFGRCNPSFVGGTRVAREAALLL